MKLKTMDLILLIMAVAIGIFTIAMVILFCIFQSVPDTLITAFFSCFGAEGGFMAMIMVTKRWRQGNDETTEEINIQ